MDTEISKKDQRHQNKKRKMEAYLRLAEDNERERNAKKRVSNCSLVHVVVLVLLDKWIRPCLYRAARVTIVLLVLLVAY